MRLSIVMLGLFIVSFADADEKRLDIQSDTKASSYLVETSSNPEQPVVVVKRVRAGATSYYKRMFDCDAGTTRDLGSSENLSDLADGCLEGEMVLVAEDTVVYQLSRQVCGR